MAERRKRGSISEDESSLLLERYSVTTILSLLHEICQFSSTKIDWAALVKKSSTGISSAREYQMLWRHLAYRDMLLEKVDEDAEPLDDDSDIEFELDVVPSVSSEASSEAVACVKVLSSFGLPSDNSLAIHSIIEVPLTINVPKGQIPCACLDEQKIACPSRGAYITVPVSVQRPTQSHLASNVVVDGNVQIGPGMPAKKKRKLWSKEEDDDLIAAVQKYGEGNWASILKGDFKHERTAPQLSQRWSIIRKRRGISTYIGSTIISSTQSEQVLATRKAVSMALNMPTLGSFSTRSPGMAHSNACLSSSVLPAAAPSTSSETLLHSATRAPQQASAPSPQQACAPPVSQMDGLKIQSKSHITAKKIPNQSKSSSATNSLIQAAAVAAGGRIANRSAAASFFKAAHSRAAVHIGPVGTSVSTSSVQGMKLFPAARTRGLQSRGIRPPVMPMHPVNYGVTSSALKTGIQQGQESCLRPPLSSCLLPGSLVQKVPSDSKTQECAESVVGEVHTIDMDEAAKAERNNLVVGKVHSSGSSIKKRTIAGLVKNLLNSGATDDSPVVNESKGVESQSGTVAKVVNEDVSERRPADDTVAGEPFKCQDVHADVVQDHQ